MHDSELVNKILQNDESAFEELIRKYKKLVYSTCNRILQNPADADDMFQEVFLEVYKSLVHLRNFDDMSGWIFRIAYSKCISHLRRKNPARAETTYDNDQSLSQLDKTRLYSDTESPDIALEKKEVAVLLFKKIDQLPENQKTALLLHKFEGYSHREICEQMNLSQASVESLIYRAKVSLRKSLLTFFKNI